MATRPNQTFLNVFLRRLYRKTASLGWDVVGMLALAHFLLAWTGMHLAGEAEIAAPGVFFYFYAVTVSTIGYGDFSPATLPGRLFFVSFLLPGGIAIFTAVIGKAVGSVATLVTRSWKNAMKGQLDHSALRNHTIVFGWDRATSPRLVEQLLRDLPEGSEPDIVVVSDVLDENPVPETVRFVRSGSLSSNDAIRRSGVATACVVILACDDDAKTLETGMAIDASGTRPRIVALFRQEEKAVLFEKAIPNAETAVPLPAETLARTARDRGAADLQRAILSIHDDNSQFSATLPEGDPVSYGKLFSALRSETGACLIGTMREFGHVDVNPRDFHELQAGDTVYYLSGSRIDQDDFSALVENVRRQSVV